MASDVVMPKMGYDMEEGKILHWVKSEGDEVEKGDTLAEIETGKVDIEIEAFDAGVLRAILVGEGETVPVGTPIAIIAGADEEIVIPEKPPASARPAGRQEAERDAVEAEREDRRMRKNGKAAGIGAEQPSGADRHPPGARADGRTTGLQQAATGDADDRESEGRVRASPLARKMAADNDLQLERLAPGSGPHGRVVRVDVEDALREGVPRRIGAAEIPAGMPMHREELSRIRQTIARRLTESWQATPHIFLTMAVQTDRLLEVRRQINEGLAAMDGGKVSLNDLIVKACARALVDHPRINVSWDDGERVVHERVSVGVAVALDDGLITLTLADADRRTVSELAADIRDKAERARAGKLSPSDFDAPSTFTVSKLGMYGFEAFTAIINPPEAAILAVGASVPSAVVDDGEVVVRNVMRMTLAADHRVIDGAAAAEFLVTLRDLLQNPMAMLA